MIREIRLIKELPDTPVGSEFEVYTFSDGAGYIRVPNNSLYLQQSIFTLSSLKGWYEWVKEMPKEGTEFYYVSMRGFIFFQKYCKDDEFYNTIIDFQGYMKTKEEAEAFRDKIGGLNKCK